MTLTCQEATTDIGIVYAWYFKGTKVESQSDKTFQIDSIRDKGGDYGCAVKTAKLTTFIKSDAKNVLFLCKYNYFPIHPNSNVTLRYYCFMFLFVFESLARQSQYCFLYLFLTMSVFVSAYVPKSFGHDKESVADIISSFSMFSYSLGNSHEAGLKGLLILIFSNCWPYIPKKCEHVIFA